jgi:YegS/Rv2252/BmrU family lipid kinase
MGNKIDMDVNTLKFQNYNTNTAADGSVRRHLFIINPRSFRFSGGTDRISDEIREYFSGSSQEFHIHISRYPRDAVGIIHKFAVDIPDNTFLRVYAVGGDGILFDCLNGIVGLPNTELAAMPYGNTNDFVKAFGKKNEQYFRDLSLQTSSDTVETDIIRCDNNYAMNLCLIGVEASGAMLNIRVGKVIERNLRVLVQLLMPAVFLICGLSGQFNKKVRMQRYDIAIDGEEYSGNYGGIYFANGPYYGGGYSAVPSAVPDDGLLDVLFYKSLGLLKSLSLIPDYTKGRHGKYPEIFTCQRGKKIAVRSDIPLIVNLDGETFFDTNLEVEVVPRAVRFVAPQGLRYERTVGTHESK